MIKYLLRCKTDQHEFEAWFGKGSDFDDQNSRGLVICPLCGGKTVEKAPMAPAVVRTSKRALPAENLESLAEKIRQDLQKNHKDVGDKFTDEARAMHYGEKPERGIYGTASPDDAKALSEEGVPVIPLPDILVPKPKKKLN